MSTDLIDFGKKVKEQRKKMGYSQQQLADLLEYTSRSTITKIEKGERDLPIDKLKLLAKALNTTPEHLVGWDNATKNVISLTEFDLSLLSEYEKMELDMIISNNLGMFMARGKDLTENDKEEIKRVLIKAYFNNRK